MFNATAIGNLGNDAEIRTGKENKNFLTFSIAHNEKKGDDKVTRWIDCIYHKENMAEFLKKGKKVFVHGSVTIKEYNGRETITINVKELELL